MNEKTNENRTLGFPRGWFVVGFGDDFAPGEVHPKRLFARDVIVWRNTSGEARVMDAHCPHLGAHIGHGGAVVGDQVRCPFHGWEFDGRGACTRVPYANRIPAKARIRTWPTLERNGVVMVWYDEEGGEPEDYIPTLAQFGAEGWSPWIVRTMRIKTHPREVVENVADVAHFGPVHSTNVLEFEASFDGPRAQQRIYSTGHDAKGVLRYQRNVATYHGPAFQVSEMEAELNTVMLNAHVPLEENELQLWIGLLVQGLDDETDLGRKLGTMWIEALQDGYLQDVSIWENKVWRDVPTLCDGDGPIGDLRRWYAQFYGLQRARP